VCHRYPGTKPSDYLEIDDPYTAFQLDIALAIKGSHNDTERSLELNDYLGAYLSDIMRALGVKKPPNRRELRYKEKEKNLDKPNKIPTLSEAVKSLGGSGVVLSTGRKNG
jgi:hypothetical protein